MHSYIDCEIVTSNDKNHHAFKVRTDVGLQFMFQVSDKAALQRWVNWFRGGSTLPNTFQKEEAYESSQSTTPAKMEAATFGGMNHNATEFSSFYQHMDDQSYMESFKDNSQSALYQQSTESRNILPMGAGNSFGVMDRKASLQRYS